LRFRDITLNSDSFSQLKLAIYTAIGHTFFFPHKSRARKDFRHKERMLRHPRMHQIWETLWPRRVKGVGGRTGKWWNEWGYPEGWQRRCLIPDYIHFFTTDDGPSYLPLRSMNYRFSFIICFLFLLKSNEVSSCYLKNKEFHLDMQLWLWNETK
jgi:hypothetical protein